MIRRIITFQNTFIAYISAIILLMALPLNSGEFNNIFILHFRGDYFLHAILFLPWAFFGFFLQRRSWLWLSWGLLFAVFAEGIQYLLPYRAFNVNDVLANVMGVLAGFGALFVYLGIRSVVLDRQ